MLVPFGTARFPDDRIDPLNGEELFGDFRPEPVARFQRRAHGKNHIDLRRPFVKGGHKIPFEREEEETENSRGDRSQR